KVINALETALALDQGTLDCERQVIADYGNMSSPTILFVLQQALAKGLPARSLLTALGPGFSASCVALRHVAWAQPKSSLLWSRCSVALNLSLPTTTPASSWPAAASTWRHDTIRW